MAVVDAGVEIVDERAVSWLPQADADVQQAWHGAVQVASTDPPGVSLSAGDRPTADVEVLAGAVAACEYALAARLHAASTEGALPFPTSGGMLRARGWSGGVARRLARCGALAAQHPALAAAWAAGIITAEHVDPLARATHRLAHDELEAVIVELSPRWGHWSPEMVARLVAGVERMLHPPADPSPEEAEAHSGRALSFAVLGETVLISGELPRVEGEVVIAAIDALAERLRSTVGHVPAAARRADALVQLVNEAHAADLLPNRGGLPVALTVTMDRTQLGDPVWSTSRGHLLTVAETRWAGCDAVVTPVLVGSEVQCGSDPTVPAASQMEMIDGAQPAPEARIAALAATLFDARIPMDLGRSARTASAGQRRALAARDRGCIMPGCGVPAEACQTHHLQEWSEGGTTDLANMALLCWAHHRQVDLRMWTIEPRTTPPPASGGPPPESAGTRWPANNGAPFTVSKVPRHAWRP